MLICLLLGSDLVGVSVFCGISLDLGIMSGFQGKRRKRWTCSEGIPAMSSIRKCNGQYLEQYLWIIGEVTE